MAKKRSNGEGSIYPRKNGLWCGCCTVIINGKEKKKYVYGKTQKIAKDKLKAIQDSNLRGTISENSSMFFEDWMYEWLVNYKKLILKQTTYENYMIYFGTHIKNSKLGKTQISKLTTTQLQAYYNEKLVNGRSDGKGKLSNRSVRYLHIIIHGALEQAVRNGLISKNVSSAAVLPAREVKEIVPLSTDEVKKLIEVAKDSSIYTLILLEIFSGLRKGEILAITWNAINFDEKKLYVRHSLCRVLDTENTVANKYKLILMEPKTSKSKRCIPLNDMVIAALKKHKKYQNEEKIRNRDIYNDQDLVFAMPDGNFICPRKLLRMFHSLLKKAGIERKRFHDMRHTFASILLNEGESPKVIQELMGHSSISTTIDIYTHLIHETKVKSIDKLTDKIINS
ncbi:tyrosine-type recombinase/integrase [Anaerocolumna xylanovorans]|uniref:Site-specific recombinase XerD n=1 Tax=Anaerocolumna xylanovorans DSM 12503 TaxID=1121345 RepID=A0A1M7Y8H8_9FIRM|nr:site-specific integrase [Anaerocolumna xylanovorans]SHO48919.1 Site-specific recombinase XerD [Anaerocolumna xylanovorans DSM 12503]